MKVQFQTGQKQESGPDSQTWRLWFELSTYGDIDTKIYPVIV